VSKKRTGIFYWTTDDKSADADYTPIRFGAEVVGYVRMEVTSWTLSEALDDAAPRDGESVMNTHHLKVKSGQ
jgi:hypothetical protein